MEEEEVRQRPELACDDEEPPPPQASAADPGASFGPDSSSTQSDQTQGVGTERGGK